MNNQNKIFKKLIKFVFKAFFQRFEEIEKANNQLSIRIELLEDKISSIQKRNTAIVTKLFKLNFNLKKDPILEKPYEISFDEQLRVLRSLEPLAFDAWWQCFLNGMSAYESHSEIHLSSGENLGAQLFEKFIQKYMHGKVLDIGCGPQFYPSYLEDALLNENIEIYGVDPIMSEHPFSCYQGFAECLPWPDEVFDVVICATSLDHCLSLENALDEIERKMKKSARLLCWVGFIKGSPPYNPKSSDIKPVDEYHLFHFDQSWFEELMNKKFKLIDVESKTYGCFYCFEKEDKESSTC